MALWPWRVSYLKTRRLANRLHQYTPEDFAILANMDYVAMLRLLRGSGNEPCISLEIYGAFESESTRKPRLRALSAQIRSLEYRTPGNRMHEPSTLDPS